MALRGCFRFAPGLKFSDLSISWNWLDSSSDSSKMLDKSALSYRIYFRSISIWFLRTSDKCFNFQFSILRIQFYRIMLPYKTVFERDVRLGFAFCFSRAFELTLTFLCCRWISVGRERLQLRDYFTQEQLRIGDSLISPSGWIIQQVYSLTQCSTHSALLLATQVRERFSGFNNGTLNSSQTIFLSSGIALPVHKQCSPQQFSSQPTVLIRFEFCLYFLHFWSGLGICTMDGALKEE